MQIEKDNFYQYNTFVHIQDFRKIFKKTVYALLVFEDSNKCINVDL